MKEFYKMKKDKKLKVLFIASTGGHLSELLQLKPLFDKYDYSLITENTKTNRYLKQQHLGRINYLVFGTKDHLFTYFFKFIYNIFKSLFLYIKIRPKVIVTTGTHTAVPMCYIGKLFGSKIIFIETFANSKTKTLSGRIVYPIANVFIVQWESMLKQYPKAKFGGWIY
jgi:UDP-N-acetylglucosamine:LPS N-acetylglucosamine transferase